MEARATASQTAGTEEEAVSGAAGGWGTEAALQTSAAAFKAEATVARALPSA